jgi:signal peptidase
MPSSAASITHSGTYSLKPVSSEEGALDAPSPDHPLRRSPAQKLKGVLWALVPVLALGLAALMLIPAALGYHRYVITGDSMSGSIERGSIVFDDEVPVSDLREGDVITYDPPQGSGVEGPVTHRIDTIKESGKGTRFRTKGDNNETADPWTFTLDQPTQARVAFHVPYVGYAFAALSIRWVRILLIGLPALLIALTLLRRMWREAGEELERRKQGGVAAEPAPAGPVPVDVAVAPSVAAPGPATLAAPTPDSLSAPATPAPAPAAPPRVDGLPPEALAPSPSLLADLRRDVERLRESSGTMIEGLVRLRGRLEGVEVA